MGSTSIVRIILAVFLSIAMFSLIPLCQTPTAVKPEPTLEPLPPAAVEYLDALAAFNKTEGPKSMENLFNKAKAAATELARIDNRTDSSYIERINNTNLAAVRNQLPGLVIHSGPDTTGAWPNYGFFSELAKKKGLESDITFFTILEEQYRKEYLYGEINYIEELGGYASCAKYGYLIMSRDYESWLKYHKQFPNNYNKTVAEEMKDIEDLFTDPHLACGSRMEVIYEFIRFLEMVDDPALKTAVNTQYELIRNGNNSSCQMRFKLSLEPLPPAAVEYLDALAAFNKTEGPKSMGPIFDKAQTAAKALVSNPDDDLKQLCYISRIDEEDVPALKTRLTGLDFNNEEWLGAWPDYDYFLRLAEKRGLEEDIALFTLLKAQYDHGRKSYVYPFGDFQGCTIFGSLKLTNSYAKWLDYKKKYPASYREMVENEMRDIEREFTDTSPSCNSRDDVIKEYRAFLKELDKSELRDDLEEQLESIEKDKSDMQFNIRPKAK
jgi:hypothetical protein